MQELYWRSADGLRLRAVDYPANGPRAPVICIHGLTRNARDFEALAPLIAAGGRRVIAIDVRGRGGSDYDPTPANYHPGVYAMDLVALLDDLAIEQAVFLGTSMGGIITMALAGVRPQAIAGAVLNDVGPELSPIGLARIGAYVGQSAPIETWADGAAYARKINGQAFPDASKAYWEAFARRIFREQDARPVLDYDPAIAQALSSSDPQTPPPDLWPLFRALAKDRPLLLVRGALSDLIDAAIAERMLQAAPHMAYVETPRVGHAPMLTEPKAWAAIAAFLAKVP